MDFDSDARLHRMRQNFKQIQAQKATWTREQLWYGVGAGTPNPSLSLKHAQEIRNCQGLAAVVGLETLYAPKIQGQIVDVVWQSESADVRISLKSATPVAGRDCFHFIVNKHTNANYCDVVMAFFRNSEGQRTHVSVIRASRVYKEGAKNFYWSPTKNKDVLENRIDLRRADARQMLLEAVASAGLEGLRETAEVEEPEEA
jgi:hypothetical protein